MEEKSQFTESEKEEIVREFISKMQSRFRKEEAKDVHFSMGNFITDLNIGVITKVDDGKVEFSLGDEEEIRNCDMGFLAPFEVFEKIDQGEITMGQVPVIEDDRISYTGDIGLLYEMSNIFDLLV